VSSSKHPLAGATLKIVRAQKHLDSLNEEIGRYVSTKPYRLVANRNGNVRTAKIIVNKSPPDELGCIVGDCVTNIRASLDYIAWALAAKYSGGNLSERDEKSIFFPLCKRATDFAGDNRVTHLKNVCRVPAAAMNVIKSVQPYQTGYQVLNKISLLVNYDKHRTLLLCIGGIERTGSITIQQGGKTWSNLGGTFISVNVKAGGPRRGRKAPIEMKMEGEPTIYVTFKDGPMPDEIADLILSNAIKCAKNIIPRFKRFFS